MKKLIILFITVLTFISTNAQSNGDQLRKEGKLLKAIEAYKTHFKKNPNNSRNTYNLACTIALTFQEKDSAFHYLEIALKEDNTLWCLADNDLFFLSHDERWSTIEEQQLSKYQSENGELENPEYAKKLLRLIMKDQVLDYQIDMAKFAYMKEGNIPHWYYPIAHYKSQISKGNFAKMEQLFKQYGWPTYKSVGKLAADGPLLVINHHEKEEIRMKYLPKIKEACLQKQGSCMEYAKIQDRILVNTEQPQLYGMQFHYDKNRNLVPFPIKNPEYVDQRRTKIGLEPIAVYLKRKINYDWKVEQKRK